MIVLLRLALGPIGAGAAFALSALLLLTTLTQCSNANAARGQFKTAEAGRVKAVGELAECRADLSRLSVAVDQQNEAVEQFRTDSARRLDAAQKAVREAQEAARGAKARAGRILASRGSGDAAALCQSAENVLRGGEG